ncbi:MAG: membrane integrity-associated transporter subunit PqiC [Cytophaga sp.]|nr:membrane integrity-associated transporter subunit PqiC [Undibacterium sp.]
MTHSINRLKTTSSGLILMMSTLLCSCSVLTPAKVSPTNRYSFDNAVTVARVSQKIAAALATKTNGPTIVVSVPHAAAGFDSQHIVYVRQAHKLEYFQQSEWIEAPSVMLTPLVSSALERSGRFNSVVQSPTSVIGQLRLDLDIVRLQQEFFSVPSKVHFTLRAHLLDTSTRQVIAWREFDILVVSSSEDPYGGVIAANNAIRRVMDELAEFCIQAVDEQMTGDKKPLIK